MYCRNTRLHPSPPPLPKTHPLHKVKQSTPIQMIISLLNIQLDNHTRDTTFQSTIQAFVCDEDRVKNLSSPNKGILGVGYKFIQHIIAYEPTPLTNICTNCPQG